MMNTNELSISDLNCDSSTSTPSKGGPPLLRSTAHALREFSQYLAKVFDPGLVGSLWPRMCSPSLDLHDGSEGN